MNLLLLNQRNLGPGMRFKVEGQKASYLLKTRRVQLGDLVPIGLVNGPSGVAGVTSLASDSLELEVLDLADTQAVPSTSLILALPRPQILKKVLFAAAQLGTYRILLTGASRVQKSYFQSSLLEEKRYQEFLILGLEQAKRTHLPEVSLYSGLSKLFQKEHEWLANAHSKCVASTTAAEKLSVHIWPIPRAGRVIAIGPEGGWEASELSQFQEHEFTPVSLGLSPLRVEVALVYLWGQLDLIGIGSKN